MSKKVIKLLIDRNFQLIGIVSNLSNYKLSWLINSNIGLNLKQLEDIVVNRKEIKCDFSNYNYNDNGIVYNLISNKSKNINLITKLKHIDYFFQIEPNLSKNKITNLIENLKKIESITSVLEIVPQNLSSADYNFF